MSVEKFRPYKDGKIQHEGKPYSSMLNRPFQECENLEALGLWAHFQTLPENWIISPKYIQNKFKIGKDKCYSLLRYLIKVNLLSRKRMLNEDGTHAETLYIIRNGDEFINQKEENKPLTDFQEAVYPLPDLPDPVQPEAVFKDTINKNTITNENKKRESTLLSDDFKPKQETIDEILTIPGLTSDDLNFEHNKFLAYYQQSTIESTNWDKSYLLWMLKASQYLTNKRKKA